MSRPWLSRSARWRSRGGLPATAARALGGYGYASPGVRLASATAPAASVTRQTALPGRWSRGPPTTVGLVVGDIENPFFAAAARGLSRRAGSCGLHRAARQRRRARRPRAPAVDALRARQVDGLVVVPAPGTAADLVARAEVPLVQLDRFVAGSRPTRAGAERRRRGGRRRAPGAARATGGSGSSPTRRASRHRRSASAATGEPLGGAGIPVDPRLVSIGGPHARPTGHAAARRC